MTHAFATVPGSLARPGSLPTIDFLVQVPLWLKQSEPVACATNPELFFPLDYTLRHRMQVEEARNQCLRCPVRDECAEWAVPQPQLDGIWGALTPPERRRIRTRKSQPYEDRKTA